MGASLESMLSGLGGIGGGAAALIGGGSSILGDYASFRGQEMTNQTMEDIARSNNEFNSAEAAKNRDFQERMSDTQMQRRVEDLKAANLNPGLAYQQGGAAAPSGSQASSVSTPNLGNPGYSFGALGNQITSALALNTQEAQIENLKASANKMNVEAGTEIPASVARIQSETGLNQTRAAEVQRNIEMLDIQLAPGGIAAVPGSMYANKVYADSQFAAAKMQIANMDVQTQMDTMQSLIKARNDENYAASIGAKNIHDASDTEFGKIMAFFKLLAPAVSTAAQAVGAGADVIR